MAEVSDLELERDPSGRFLPWVVAVMVFLATLALAGALSLGQAITGWHDSVAGRLTVQVADLPDQPMASRLLAAEKFMRAQPGVVAVRIVERGAVEALIAPWIGVENITPDLPLPGLIDIELAPKANIDFAAMAGAIETVVPGARLDDLRPWLDRLVRLARLLQALGASTIMLIGIATVAMVVFATRAGLATHGEVIDLLHMMGARDAYIARAFQRHVFKLSLTGALLGVVVAVGILLLIRASAATLDTGLLPAIGLGYGAWSVLAVLPIGAVMLAVVTARLTVLGALKSKL